MNIDFKPNENQKTMQDYVNEYNATHEDEITLKQAHKTLGMALLVIGLVLLVIWVVSLLYKSSKAKDFGKFKIYAYDVIYETDENGIEHELKKLKFEYYDPSGERFTDENEEYIETELEIGDIVDYSQIFHGPNASFEPNKVYGMLFAFNNFGFVAMTVIGGLMGLASICVLVKAKNINE